MKVTIEILNKVRTAKGGYTKVTLLALGVRKLRHGWMKRLLGKEISEEQFTQAFLGSGKKPKTTNEQKRYKKIQAPDNLDELYACSSNEIFNLKP